MSNALVTFPRPIEAAQMIITAIDNKRLQTQKPGFFGPCAYAGPCALGLFIPIELRSVLDNLALSSAPFLFQQKTFTCADPDGKSFYCHAQTLHDDGEVAQLREFCKHVADGVEIGEASRRAEMQFPTEPEEDNA